MDADVLLYRITIGNKGECKLVKIGDDGKVLEPLFGYQINQLVVRFKATAKVRSLAVDSSNGYRTPIWRQPVRPDESADDRKLSKKEEARRAMKEEAIAHMGCSPDIVVYATALILRIAEDEESVGELVPDKSSGLRFIELVEDGDVRMLNVWHIGLMKQDGEFYLRKEKLRTVAAPEDIDTNVVLAHIRDLPHLFLE